MPDDCGIKTEVVLFRALLTVQDLNLPVGEPASGKRFEDYMVMRLHEALKADGDARVFPPRHTLHEPTYSGVHHQFDIVVAQPLDLVAVECKFRGTAHIEQLFATQGKLTDYHHRPYGIFVTTARGVNDDMYCYAIAHGVQLISPGLPPIQYMRDQAKPGSDLASRLVILQHRAHAGAPARHVLVEWRNNYMRFCDEGYR